METSYRRLTPEQWKQVNEDADLAATFGLFTEEVLEDADDEAFEEIFDALPGNERYFEIGRYWDGLYYLFNGKSGIEEADSTELFALPINGGVETKFEATYGWVRFLSTEDVQRVAQALHSLDVVSLRSRFEPVKMNQERVYPGAWAENDWPELLRVFHELQGFFDTAGKAGEVILVSRD